MSELHALLDAERASLFLVDPANGDLVSKAATGVGESVGDGSGGGGAASVAIAEIRIPSGRGLVGIVARTGETINIRDAYADARFNRDVDRASGFRTRNILCVPVLSADGEIMGAVQVINKRGHAGEAPAAASVSAGDAEAVAAPAGGAAGLAAFTEQDVELCVLFAGHLASSVSAIRSRNMSSAQLSEAHRSLTQLHDTARSQLSAQRQRMAELAAERDSAAAALVRQGKFGASRLLMVHTYALPSSPQPLSHTLHPFLPSLPVQLPPPPPRVVPHRGSIARHARIGCQQ